VGETDEKRVAGMEVMTVLGRVPAAQLGITLVHEHLVMDTRSVLDRVHRYDSEAASGLPRPAEARWNPGAFRDNYDLSDPALCIEDIKPLRDTVLTVVDCTPMDIGRDPLALKTVAAETGIQVVMGSGWYLHGVRSAEHRKMTAEEMSDLLVQEFRAGVDDTRVRPGIIGELGTSSPVDDEEFKALHAAATASLQTGLAVSVHLHPWSKHGIEVVSALRDSGLPMEKLILNHLTTAHNDPAYQDKLLQAGCYLAFDLFGFDHSLLTAGRYPPSDYDVAVNIVRLVRAGHATRLLISQDIGVRTRLRAFGGWGYGHLTDHVVPLLSQLGLTEAELKTILVANPARVLAIPPTKRASTTSRLTLS
jgi:phosphotriesterase-related protein